MGREKGRRDFWRAHIRAWSESGLTQRAYCREQGLSEAQFSYWKPWLRKKGQRQRWKAPLVPLKVIEKPTSETVRGDVRGAASDAGELALVFGKGLRLEVGEGFDAATLRRVLEVLGHVG